MELLDKETSRPTPKGEEFSEEFGNLIDPLITKWRIKGATLHEMEALISRLTGDIILNKILGI